MKSNDHLQKLHTADIQIDSSVLVLSKADEMAFSEFLKIKKKAANLDEENQSKSTIKTKLL